MLGTLGVDRDNIKMDLKSMRCEKWTGFIYLTTGFSDGLMVDPMNFRVL